MGEAMKVMQKPYFKVVFYKWKCNFFCLVFGKKSQSLSLVVRTIECFISRIINFLGHKN